MKPTKSNETPKYLLHGQVRMYADRIRVCAELQSMATLERVFQVRYQTVPGERDKILGEIARRVHQFTRAA